MDGTLQSLAQLIFPLYSLFIPVWFDGVKVDCLVDTGAVATIVRQSDASRIGTLGPPVGQAYIRGLNGDVQAAVGRPVKNIGASEMGWPGAMILVLPDDQMPGLSCILGMDLLAQQPFVVNWDTKTIQPVPPARPEPARTDAVAAVQTTEEG